MASATSSLSFTFSLASKTKPSNNHNLLTPNFPKINSISPFHRHPKLQITSKSIDVSKEDKPTSEQPNPASQSPPSEPGKFDKRRLEEKFAILNTGIYDCRSCGFRYDEATGDPSYPIPPGLPFDKLPEDWRCPTCGAAKSFFESKSVEIAGFAQNQQFGLGGNALTAGQKAVLIYGSLFLAFLLFLSGYFIQ